MELAGDVSGLALLDTCCSADARQSLSWANLGASVTGCDITPSAIQNATQTARRIGCAPDATPSAHTFCPHLLFTPLSCGRYRPANLTSH